MYRESSIVNDSEFVDKLIVKRECGLYHSFLVLVNNFDIRQIVTMFAYMFAYIVKVLCGLYLLFVIFKIHYYTFNDGLTFTKCTNLRILNIFWFVWCSKKGKTVVFVSALLAIIFVMVRLVLVAFLLFANFIKIIKLVSTIPNKINYINYKNLLVANC